MARPKNRVYYRNYSDTSAFLFLGTTRRKRETMVYVEFIISADIDDYDFLVDGIFNNETGKCHKKTIKSVIICDISDFQVK